MGESSTPPRDDGIPGETPRNSPSSPLTTEVLERVRRRDPDALAILFDEHFGRIYGLAITMLRDRAAAEDLTQEVFLRVYRAAHQIDIDRNPKPWLMTITANLCREKWRSREGQQAKRTSSLDTKPEVASALANGAADPEGRLREKERDRLLREAIGELPEPMRLVVILTLQDLNRKEVAEILDLDPAVVRQRYHRALKKLREKFPDGWK